MDKVILSQRYLDEAIAELRKICASVSCDLIIAEDERRSLSALLDAHPDCRALITFLSDTVDADLLRRAKNLRIVANYAVGYNNIDVAAALERGIYVTHTPDILTEATADLTMALTLAVARRIVPADCFLRQGRFSGWEAKLFLGKELAGATLGVVGMGRIGLAVALRALGFGMKVAYFSRTRRPDLEKRHSFVYLPFVDLLKRADVVSVHIPYSADVHHLFDRDAFALMKRDAIFINASRGGLMNEADLAEALGRNELFGAGLDVYESEPAVDDRLLGMDNVVLAPHIGSATFAARLGMARMTMTSVGEALAGQVPSHLVPEWREKLQR